MDGAEKAYRAAIEADPGYADAHNNLGYLRLTGLPNLKGAEEAYSNALAIDSSHTLAQAGLHFAQAALIEQSCGDLTVAVGQYEEATVKWGAVLGAEHEAPQMARAAAARVRSALP